MSLHERLASGEPQYGLWLGLANAYTAEICAGSGADWLLIDGQHAPNTLTTIMAQLHAVKGASLEVIARTPDRDPAIVKQYLDLGVRNLLVPGVTTPEHAAGVVAATRYPPAGTRGVSGTLTRASDFGRAPDYGRGSDDVCLFVQIESKAALAALPAIASTEGVDGVFLSPADLAASMGCLGNPRSPEVREAMVHALETAHNSGIYSGLYASSPADGRAWTIEGACLVAIGSDVGVLQRSTRSLFHEVQGSAIRGRW